MSSNCTGDTEKSGVLYVCAGCGCCAGGDDGRAVEASASVSVDDDVRRLFSDSDIARRGAGAGGLFAAFSHDDDDDATSVTASNAFGFMQSFDTSVADMSVASDCTAGFQINFADDANHTSDDDNTFSLF